MASDDSSGPRPAAPIVLRIKLRYDDVEAMVQRFATNVGRSGLFLPTKSLQPIGAEIKFELRLADDTPALVGLGRVRAATPPDPSNPKATFGMAIELLRVTPQSRALILRMLERRRAMGLPEVGLPMTADIDAARRAEAVTGHARDPVSGPLPVVAPVPVSAPGAPVSATAPVPAIDTPPGEALLTAPRRTTGPIMVAKVLAVAPLAPEPPRRKRMAMSELIESASGPIASVAVAVPDLDDDVDLAAALVRARALIGGALDAELDALAEVAAAPLEISIEVASAELARQLGGSAVRRDRSARWAVPPATTSQAPAAPVQVAAQADAPAAETHAAEMASEAAEAHAAERAQPQEDPREWAREAFAGTLPHTEPEADPGSLALPDEIAGDHDGAMFALPYADNLAVEPRRVSRSGHHEVEPGQIAEELHQLSELDLEDVEHTEMGDMPVDPGAPQGDRDGSSELDHELLAARLEAQLAAAEAEADAEVLGLAAARGAEPYGDGDGDPAAGYPDEAVYDLGRARDEPDDPPLDIGLEEIYDFEILAEADADDEDLLAAHGEQDASDSRERPAAPQLAEHRARAPSELDFAARLDLGDDSERHEAAGGGGEFSTQHVLDSLHDDLADRLADSLLGDLSRPPRSGDPLLDSAGHALAAFDTDEPFDELAAPEPGRVVQPLYDSESTGSFTLAGIPSDSLDLEPSPPVRHAAAGTPRPARSRRASIYGEPAILRGAPAPQAAPSLHGAPVEDHELEHALEALDVDLDDLSIPHAATQLARDPSSSRPAPAAQAQGRTPSHTPAAMPSRAARQTGAVPVAPAAGRGAAPRLTTEDGVVIDFDDDDD